jgi:phospholipid transport system substrate-binding protein
MRMLRLLTLLLAALLPISAMAQTGETASDYINRAGNQALSILATKGVKSAEGNAEFNQFMQDNFDIPAIGKFVLGRAANTATPAQMDEYNRLFSTLVRQIYTERLSAFSGETFKVTGQRAEGSNGDQTVSTQIIHTNGAPATNTDWRVRPSNGGWKIVDVSVEGVSMSVTQRSEFASVIQRSGGKIDGLLQMLRQKTANAPAVVKQ